MSLQKRIKELERNRFKKNKLYPHIVSVRVSSEMWEKLQKIPRALRSQFCREALQKELALLFPLKK